MDTRPTSSSSSSPLPSALPDPFTRFPFEILSRIYFTSANPALPYASRSLYHALSGDYCRLTFCANLFDSSYDWGWEYLDRQWRYPRLDLIQSEVVAKSWFDLAFAKTVEAEVKRRNRLVGRPLPYVAVGAKIPRWLLCAPWTTKKTTLLKQLASYGFRAHWANERRSYPGLTEAITEGLDAVVSLYCGTSVKALVAEEHLLAAVHLDATFDVIHGLMSALWGDGPVDNIHETKAYKAMLRKILAAECSSVCHCKSPANESRCPEHDKWESIHGELEMIRQGPVNDDLDWAYLDGDEDELDDLGEEHDEFTDDDRVEDEDETDEIDGVQGAHDEAEQAQTAENDRKQEEETDRDDNSGK